MTPRSSVRRLLYLSFALPLAALIAGCGSGGGVSTSPGNPTPSAISFSGASLIGGNTLAFGSVVVGASSAAQSLTVTNSGGSTLTLASITLSDMTNYALTSTCGGSLAASASCSLSVTFTPKSGASLPATLTFSDNSGGNSSTQVLSLTGTGVVPLGQASLTPSALNFITTGSSQTATLTNAGSGPLSIASIGISGTGAADFAIVAGQTTCGTTLAAGSNCSITIAFTAAQNNTIYSATLTVTDNAGGVTGSTQTVGLTGIQSTQCASVTPGSLTFSSPVNTQAMQQSVTLTNCGTTALQFNSINVTGANTSSFSADATACAGSIAASASCSIKVGFFPAAAQTYTATLNVSDNAPNSPQTVALTGTGTAPIASLSATSIMFNGTQAGTTSAAQSVTLTNTGNAPLSISSIALGGTNAANFATTNNCGASLAVSISCSISATFSPAAAQTYTATITLTTNAAASPQTITLTGTGASSAVTYAMYVLPDPGSGYGSGTMAKLYSLVNNAKTSIDMTIYELQDTNFSNDLVAACGRGVKVRVVLDQGHKSENGSAYNQLTTTPNCNAVYSNAAFSNTHEKAFIVDGTTLSLMSLNLQAQYYTTTRDFAMVYNDPADIAAVQATFNMDYAAGNGGASDFNYVPSTGTDLIWSPTTAAAAMVNIIANAKSTLVIDAEEFSSSSIVNAVAAACQRGVNVRLTIENEGGSYNSELTTIKNAGCAPHQYTSSTGFYVHAKAVVADYGLSTQSVYMGSINYSDTSLTKNRELGMYVVDSAAVQLLYTKMGSDYTGGATY